MYSKLGKDMTMRNNTAINRFLPALSLLILLLASCAPAAPVAPSVEQPSVQQPAPSVAVEPSATPVVDAGNPVAQPTEAVESAPLPIATSRGPNLEATDPNTVSLASGQLQFVEFFRYT